MWAKSYVFFIHFLYHSFVRLDPWHGVRMFRKVVNIKRNILSHALGFSPLL